MHPNGLDHQRVAGIRYLQMTAGVVNMLGGYARNKKKGCIKGDV